MDEAPTRDSDNRETGATVLAGLPPGAPRPEHMALPVTAGLLARRSQSVAIAFPAQYGASGVVSAPTRCSQLRGQPRIRSPLGSAAPCSLLFPLVARFGGTCHRVGS